MTPTPETKFMEALFKTAKDWTPSRTGFPRIASPQTPICASRTECQALFGIIYNVKIFETRRSGLSLVQKLRN